MHCRYLTGLAFLGLWGLLAGSLVGVVGCSRKTSVKACPDGLMLDEKRSVEGKEQWCVSGDGKRARWTAFFPDGKKRQQTCGFANGKSEGSYLSWHQNDKVAIEGVYKEGEKIGKWTQWNPKGVMVARGEYRFGNFIAGAPVGGQAKCENMKP